jgi:hypothetical protein
MDAKHIEGFELDLQIEELEAKIAPDGSDTVLPLSIPVGGSVVTGGGHHHHCG